MFCFSPLSFSKRRFFETTLLEMTSISAPARLGAAPQKQKDPLVSDGERVFENLSWLLYPHAGGKALQQQQQQQQAASVE